MPVFVHDRILQLLEAEGIKTLIGIPDPSFVGMFIAAEARGWRVIAPHHEQAGAFMADGMWRMTGKPGVVVGNQGPGVANLAPAAICAAKETCPRSSSPDNATGCSSSACAKGAFSTRASRATSKRR